MSVPALSQFAVDFLVAWVAAMAITIDLVIVLAALTGRTADARRPVLLAVAATAVSRVVVAFTGIAGLSLVSVVFGLLVLLAGWHMLGGRGSTRAPGRIVDLAAAGAGAVLGAFAVSATGGAAPPVLSASLAALIGVPWLVRIIHRWAARVPDVRVGLAVVLAFLGARSVVAGLVGQSPAQDASVVALSLGTTAVVLALCAITAARIRR
ncbi:hypothetical protein [Saccharopolyspora halophila]